MMTSTAKYKPWLFPVFLVLSLAFLVQACSTAKRTTPASGPRKPVPEKPQRPGPLPKDTLEPPRWDTVKWTIVDTIQDIRPEKPSRSDSIRFDNEISKPERILKDRYQLAVILPFQATEGANPTNNRVAQWALDFYMGFRIAFDEAPTVGPGFHIRVFESHASDQKINTLIQSGVLEKMDVVIGPYRSNHASILAEYVKDKPILLFSPYSASSKSGAGNDHYLQANPALETHLQLIFETVRARASDEQPIVFVYGEGETESSRYEFWKEKVDALPVRERSRFQYKKLKIADPSFSEVLIDSLLPGMVHNFVVLPSWDEGFVHNVLRKLVAEKLEKSVTVFGLPQWTTFEKIEAAHYEALQVHITCADYYDPKEPSVRQLNQKMKELLGQPLNSDVMWGYRCGQYLVKALTEEGALFQRFMPFQSSLPSQDKGWLLFEAVSKDGAQPHYENKQLRLLRFQDGTFVPSR